MSDFKKNEREMKISEDEWELLHIFTDISEPFSFATYHVFQTMTPTITDVLFILQVLQHNFIILYLNLFLIVPRPILMTYFSLII